MSKELTFIPASEAAEMVGVSTQTIRNLCKAKTIRYQQKSQLFYPCKEDVERYADTITEIHEAERSIEEYKQLAKKLSDQARAAIEETKGQLEEANMFPERIRKITEIQHALMPIFADELTDREFNIVNSFLSGERLPDIAEKLGLTSSRIGAIWYEAVWKINHFSEKQRHKDELIAELQQKINELETLLKEFKPDAADAYKEKKLYPLSVYDLDFSVRTMNALKSAEIETVGDLTKFSRAKLLDFRNFGKKSIQEIDEWLAAHGLAFAQ